MENIRNFCIIAHIDHGKSTLADRLLESTGAVSDREKQDQLLDNMDLERERGITIKSHAVQMNYQRDGVSYVLNLIDTPGHVDFSYEVSRSIAACEGALLIVDAAQSIQAQTISNLYLALENDLEIIPVLNKVDLPSANPEEVTDDIVDLLGCKAEEVIPASAKTGLGIENIINAIIDIIPAPKGSCDEPLQALIFDSVYNPFRGVETYFRVINGSIKKNQQVKFIATGKTYGADEVGTLNLKQSPKPEIFAGDVGYLITGIITGFVLLFYLGFTPFLAIVAIFLLGAIIYAFSNKENKRTGVLKKYGHRPALYLFYTKKQQQEIETKRIEEEDKNLDGSLN
ncbi:GTP-binding protein, partial [Flavobacteriaceae bacterium]|nr:GTP-binding protein [Flavobacteriaceae bacterium]